MVFSCPSVQLFLLFWVATSPSWMNPSQTWWFHICDCPKLFFFWFLKSFSLLKPFNWLPFSDWCTILIVRHPHLILLLMFRNIHIHIYIYIPSLSLTVNANSYCLNSAFLSCCLHSIPKKCGISDGGLRLVSSWDCHLHRCFNHRNIMEKPWENGGLMGFYLICYNLCHFNSGLIVG